MNPGWTIREEANSITCWAVRNGYIEDLHAGKYSALSEEPGVSQISDEQMKRLMIEISTKMAEILRMKATSPAEYWAHIAFFQRYCGHWEK